MTDKEQIIIDEVNVSKCDFYDRDKKYCLTLKMYPKGFKNPSCFSGDFQQCIQDSKTCPYTFCHNNPNCYFKQLARKTQELKTICKAFDIEYGYDEGTGVIVGRCNKLIEKENELEEYKQSLNERNKFLQDLGISAGGEFKRIKFYIESLKNKYNENARYRKALEEIEEICKNGVYDEFNMPLDECDFILDIINKARGCI